MPQPPAHILRMSEELEEKSDECIVLIADAKRVWLKDLRLAVAMSGTHITALLTPAAQQGQFSFAISRLSQICPVRGQERRLHQPPGPGGVGDALPDGAWRDVLCASIGGLGNTDGHHYVEGDQHS